MIAVADTSPLNYLLLLDEIELLPALYDVVAIPVEVHHELQHRNSPSQLKP
jgi:predicted nucleic acid-binding protein